jgi:hypothetical protein
MEVTCSSETSVDFGNDGSISVSIRIKGTVDKAGTLMKQNNTDKQINIEAATLLKTVLNQNYCKYGQEFCKPNTGIAVGSPISSIIAEMFPQSLEELIEYTLEKNIITTAFLCTVNQNYT